jgi:hypothetical protein
MAHNNPQPAYEKINFNSQEEFNNKDYDVYCWKDDEHTDYELVTDYDSSKIYFKKTNHIFGATNKKLPEPKSFSEYKFKGYTAPDIVNEE